MQMNGRSFKKVVALIFSAQKALKRLSETIYKITSYIANLFYCTSSFFLEQVIVILNASDIL